jgi:hypothetical protein
VSRLSLQWWGFHRMIPFRTGCQTVVCRALLLVFAVQHALVFCIHFQRTLVWRCGHASPAGVRWLRHNHYQWFPRVQLFVGSWAAVECVTYGNIAAGIGYALSCGPHRLRLAIATRHCHTRVVPRGCKPTSDCSMPLGIIGRAGCAAQHAVSQTLDFACASDASRGPWESLLVSYRSAGCAAAPAHHHDHHQLIIIIIIKLPN